MRSTDAEIIKSRVTSRQLLEHVGVPVLQNGFACCPLHGERTASLKVYADPRRGWHCFGCGRGGTVIDLGMALWNTDFLGACSMLNDEFQLGIPMGRPLTAEEKREFLDALTGVSLGSDAFFPFADNIKRACASGVSYIAEPGGSIRDDLVIEECDKRNVAMAFTGMRLFHH